MRRACPLAVASAPGSPACACTTHPLSCSWVPAPFTVGADPMRIEGEGGGEGRGRGRGRVKCTRVATARGMPAQWPCGPWYP